MKTSKQTEHDYLEQGFSLTSESDRIDIDAVHQFLSSTYWSPSIPLETVRKAVHGSLCFGLFHHDKQIGFARVITDKATFAYLCDVYVLEEYRGRGLGEWLMQFVLKHSDLQGLRRFSLVTRDAHGLYSKFGFKPLSKPDGHMEIFQPHIYSVIAEQKS